MRGTRSPHITPELTSKKLASIWIDRGGHYAY